jgi:hypothetical protein
LLDPFTGCFASATPQTLVLLRVALRTLRLFGSGKTDDAREYASDAPQRVTETLETYGDPDVVADALATERAVWDSYYEAIEVFAPALTQRTVAIIADCRVAS